MHKLIIANNCVGGKALDGEKRKFSVNEPDPERLRQLLQSPDGAALLRLLQKGGAGTLQAAAQAIRAGDMETARRILAPLLGGEGEALAGRLGEKL